MKSRKIIAAALASVLTFAACIVPRTVTYDTQTAFAETYYTDTMTYGDLEYQKVGDDKDNLDYVCIVGCDKAAKSVEIPDEIDGLPVREIKESSFWGCEDLAEVKLPDTLRVVGRFAFYGCYSLKNIKLPASLAYYNAYTFARCTGLESIDVDE